MTSSRLITLSLKIDQNIYYGIPHTINIWTGEFNQHFLITEIYKVKSSDKISKSRSQAQLRILHI